MQISKSDYMLFLKHPAWLWLKKYDKNKLPPVDDKIQAIFDAGYLFESYAQLLFPNGVRLGFEDYEEYLNLPARTSKALDEGVTTIFQGRFEHKQLTFICDVIKVVGDKILDLYEIKSSTRVKTEHEFDLAFQMIVLEACGYKINNIFVVHVNGDYMRSGEINTVELTTISDISEKVKEKREETKTNIKKALGVIASAKIPDISPSLFKGDSFGEWLTIYRGLTTVNPESIYDLFMVNADKIGKLEELKIKRLVDIHDEFLLSDKQKFQVLATKQNREIIDKNEIKKFLKTLVYPLYFLDYETLSSVIPAFDGISPYQQIPFQYSLHVLDKPDGMLSHYMYLHRENSNPVSALSYSLKSNIGATGTVLVWSESFEKNCNKSIAKLCPEYELFYEQLNARIVDLMIPFSANWYVHKDFGGSASLKKVLPVLVTELSYKELGIHEGDAAKRLWMEAVLESKREDSKEKILNDLEEYCKMDTLAMVEIYKQLLKI